MSKNDDSQRRRTARRQAENLRRAAATLDAIKTTAGCVDCGFNKWPEALQFDHTDPATKRESLGWVRDRSKLKTKSMLRRYLEHVSLYCVVRCANCHAHHTRVQQHWRPANRLPGGAPDVFATLF